MARGAGRWRGSGTHPALRAIVCFLTLACLLAAPAALARLDPGDPAYHQDDPSSVLEDWWRKAEAGDAQAQNALGVIHALGRGVAHDDAAAIGWFQRAAAQGLASAQNNLGVMLRNGQGVPADPGAAARWFRQAAEAGLSIAMLTTPQFREDMSFRLSTPAREGESAEPRRCIGVESASQI